MQFRLRDLPVSVRVGLTGLIITVLIGMGASMLHLVWHYERRDERAKFTLDDVRGAYRGIDASSPLAHTLREGHPETLAAADRQTLLKWLEGPRVSEDYDNMDLGDAAPAEIIARACVSCHARKPTNPDPKQASIPLEFWDDIKKVAFSRKIEPTPTKIIAISTHTHALSLATLSLALFGLALATSLPRGLIHTLLTLTGVALMIDISSWWLARFSDIFVYAIVGAGGVYNLGTTLLTVLIGFDLWLPRKRNGGTPS